MTTLFDTPEITLEQMCAAHEAAKEQHPEAILVFRNGEMYAVIGNDAIDFALLANVPLQLEQYVVTCKFPANKIEQFLQLICGQFKKLMAVIDNI